jgi:hypothetical protein
MPKTARKLLVALAVLGAAALGESALAGAASKSATPSQSTTPSQSAAPQGQPPGGPARGNGAAGGHVGRNGQREVLLTGDTAAKVKAAALAKVSGATIERVETDADHGSPYEAHMRKTDGTELEVLIDKDFQVTAVNTMQHP